MFIWLYWVSAVARGVFSCGMWALSYSIWVLVPWPGFKPRSLALEVHSLTRWTTTEVPCGTVFNSGLCYCYEGFPHSSVGKESPCNAGDPGLIPGLGRAAGEGKGYPLQYSSLEKSVNGIVPGSQRVRHDWATFTLGMVYGSRSHYPFVVKDKHLWNNWGIWFLALGEFVCLFFVCVIN